MAMAYFISLERPLEPPGTWTAPVGPALAQNDVALSERAQNLGISELLDFASQDPNELAAFLSQEGGDPNNFDLPKEDWFDSGAGLETVRALLEHVRTEPEGLRDPPTVAIELEAFARVLETAQERGIRWHLTIGPFNRI